MKEILHLSLSSKANHLTTHYLNAKESYFEYNYDAPKLDFTLTAQEEDQSKKKEEAKETILHSMTFRQGIATDGKSETFTPRAMIWDMRGGYGSLAKFNSLYDFDGLDESGLGLSGTVASSVWDSSKPIKIAQNTIPKSQYQVALDSLAYEPETAMPELTTENTKYWSDYLRLFLHPRSQQELSNWEYDPDQYPGGRSRGGGNRAFKDFEVGQAEWAEVNTDGEYLETKFRPLLEECDNLAGINMVTDVDSAWGGFTAEILTNLRDEFLPKTTLFLWALYNDETANLSRRDELSRIRSTVELTQLSSLFIPISTPSIPAALDFDFDKTSSWHVGAMQNIALESFSLLPTLSRSSYNMDFIADALSSGSNRNIVSTTHVAIEDSGIIDLTAPLFSSVKQPKPVHTFSKVGILRPPQSSRACEDVQNDSNKMSLLWDRYFQSSNLQSDGTAERSLFELPCSIPYPTPDSYPSMIKPEDHVYSSLAVTTSPNKVFSGMTRFVSKFVRGDTREQLKDDTDELARQYEWSWESDEDSDYDY